jgi:hypothetical protein
MTHLYRRSKASSGRTRETGSFEVCTLLRRNTDLGFQPPTRFASDRGPGTSFPLQRSARIVGQRVWIQILGICLRHITLETICEG